MIVHRLESLCHQYLVRRAHPTSGPPFGAGDCGGEQGAVGVNCMGAIQVPRRNNHEKLAPLTPALSPRGGERGRLRNFYELPQRIVAEFC